MPHRKIRQTAERQPARRTRRSGADQRKYDAEFIINAVKRSYSSTESVEEAATDLGVPKSTLYRWRRQYGAQGGETQTGTLASEENTPLEATPQKESLSAESAPANPASLETAKPEQDAEYQTMASENSSIVPDLSISDSSIPDSSIPNPSVIAQGKQINASELYDKTSGRCAYCGDIIALEDMSVSRIIPGNKDDHINNLLPSCLPCHQLKGALTIKSFRSKVREEMRKTPRGRYVRLPQFKNKIHSNMKTLTFYFESVQMGNDLKKTEQAEKSALSGKDRLEIYHKTNGRCAYCGIKLELKYASLSYTEPPSPGEESGMDNQLSACLPCYQLKASLSLQKFRQLVGKSNDNRYAKLAQFKNINPILAQAVTFYFESANMLNDKKNVLGSLQVIKEKKLNGKQKIYDKTNGFCAYCGEPLGGVENMTKDHIIPLSHGGIDNDGNIFPACEPCNMHKGDWLLEEYREEVKIAVKEGVERYRKLQPDPNSPPVFYFETINVPTSDEETANEAAMKRELYDKTGGRCSYCGVKLELESMAMSCIIPLFAGGLHDAKNMLPACLGCNQKKASSDLESFNRAIGRVIEKTIQERAVVQ